MNKFITLTKSSDGSTLHLNSQLIVALHEVSGNTKITIMGGDVIYTVKESVKDILKLIDKADTITLRTGYETGPR